MNIILDKSLKTDSKQPKVFNLGQIITTLQDLLDNSTIVINGEQTIILSIIDENNNVLKYLLPLDYKGESFYGLGQNILESDLISLGSVETKPYRVYTALLTQNGANPPIATVLENSLGGNPIWTYDGVGMYQLTITGAFTVNKTTVDLGISEQNFLGRCGWRDISNDTNFVGIMTFNNSNVASNGLLSSALFEVRVYN